MNELSYAPLKFTNENNNDNIFYLHNYNWKDHGYALVKRFYYNLAPLLDDEMDTIYNLTYNSYMEQKNIDTSAYRQAVWYYVLRLYGLHHDDYDYEKLHIFLNRPTKIFIEKVACDPEAMTLAGKYSIFIV